MKQLPKGAYDQLITSSLRAELGTLPANLKADTEPLSDEDLVEYLARAVADEVRSSLRRLLEQPEGSALAEINNFIGVLRTGQEFEGEALRAIRDAVASAAQRPLIPLAQSALVTNEQGLNYHKLLKSELATADRVDLICPFIGIQGLNLIFDGVAALGSRLRIITTTYLGGTNQRALDRLAETGTQIKIVYERAEQKTALHAKAWIFHRDSGFTTATVGSSNLSPRALVDGLEWNVRLSKVDAPQVLQELIVTFDRLWQNEQYESYDPARDAEKLRIALKVQSNRDDDSIYLADLQPLAHQKEALQELEYARLEGKTKNLIVAATGTGKTLLAAFDYKRLCGQYGGRPKLLFVAHRGEILKQSRAAFRAVMKEGDFGELQVGDDRADSWRHVFASVQSLSHRDLSEFARDQFDVIVIDEFHKAEAPTYVRLLEHFTPRQLLGLTATPERMDGKDEVIARMWPPTYELRLWHALDRGLLCPFHYYGLDDQTDLSDLAWTNGRYDDAELTNRYVERGKERASLIIRELVQKAADIDKMHVVAFCASIRHADFMADQFNNVGLSAKALHSRLSADVQKETIKLFRQGALPIICTVDMFNEGVDIPEIDTVLFLRPTESATIFIQQLGRGLRNHESKGALTVLDFVGQQNKKFRMDLRFRAITGQSRTELEKAVKDEFPMLPPGCNIRLDKTTQERVLRNIKEAIPSTDRMFADELRRMHVDGVDITLPNFVEFAGFELQDLYKGKRSFESVKHEAGLADLPPRDLHLIGGFAHVDDKSRARAYLEVLSGSAQGTVFERMLACSLTRQPQVELLGGVARAELVEMLRIILGKLPPDRPRLAGDLPFALNAHYSRDEIVAPFRDKPQAFVAGTFYVPANNLDIHLVTLRKSDRDFSPTTRYQDFFTAPDVLHWESPSGTASSHDLGKRLFSGSSRNLIFVREKKFDDGRTSPYMCLGFATPEEQKSEKPIQLNWKLKHSVPDHVYVRFQAAAG